MKVPFEVSFIGGYTYRIRNVSDETFELVTVTVDHPEELVRQLPDRETFGPGASRQFIIIGAHQAGGRPVEVMVSWDVHPTPYAIPLPPNI